MFSPFSKGTKNAPFYDQAARTVACIAATIEQARKSVDDLDSTAFFVVAPESQIRQGIFKEQMSRASIKKKVWNRVEAYHEDTSRCEKIKIWFDEVFIPLLERIDLSCVAWETSIETIIAANPTKGTITQNFYKKCLKYNQVLQKRGDIIHLGTN